VQVVKQISLRNLRMSFTSKALGKINGHADKYVHSMVMGVLVGGEGGIVDVFPLCHGYPSAPLIELFMEQVEHTLIERKQYIAGVYYANELPNDTLMNVYAELLASKICENEKNDMRRKSIVIYRFGGDVFTLNGTNWVKSPNSLEKQEKESTSSQQNIRDFEDHLSDTSCDWRN